MEEPGGGESKGFMTDEAVYRALQERFDNWRFAEHTDAENMQFTHNLCVAVTDFFEYLSYASSEEFSAEELPESLRPLTTHYWTHSYGTVTQTIFEQGMQVNARKREEHQDIEPRIPGFNEMARSGKTFEEMLGAIAADPNIVENIIPGSVIEDPAIIVCFSKSFGLNGIEFIVKPAGITLAVYGRRGETYGSTAYVVTYHDKPRVLAETAAHLAVLGAKHCLGHQNYDIHDIRLSELDKRFFGDLFED